MQQRRGTAAQWISTNSGNGPILNAGEIGYETDTNKFKIGDGTNHWLDLEYFLDAAALGGSIDDYIPLTQKDAASGVPSLDASKNLYVAGASIIVEGATDNAFETTLTVTDPTADRTITFPDATGTVALTSDIAELSQDAINTAISTGTGITKSYDDSANTITIGINNAALTDYLIDGVSGSSYGLIGTSAYLDVKNTNGYNKEIELDIAAVKTQLNTDGYLTTSSTSTLTNKTLTSPKINEDVAVTATATELNYVDGVTSAIQTQLDAKAPLAAPAFTGTATAVNLTISGDLTVNGTTTNINSTSLVVEDKNVVLGDVATPTDTTADGGGITLKGATDKTFNWVDSTDAWTSSEHINLASGKTLKYNGTDLVAAQSGNSGKYLTTDGTSTSWGTISGYSAPTIGSTSIASGATVTTIAGLTLTAPTLTGTVTASGDINLSAAGGPGSVIDELTLLLIGAL